MTHKHELDAHDHFCANVAWLTRLRWLAVVGQLMTMSVVRWGLGLQAPWGWLLSVVALTAGTNVGLTLWLQRRRREKTSAQFPSGSDQAIVGGVMLLDLFFLTVLVFFTGGPENPFAIFYFVNLALSAVMLPAIWAWSLTAAATTCFGALSLYHAPALTNVVQSFEEWPGFESPSQHELGLFFAFATCALTTTYFVTRVTGELHAREEDLRIAWHQRAQSQKMEALATLAAGAGHELATPLSTIAVVATELTHHLRGADVDDAVLEDVALIKSELDLCRLILDRMAGSAGEAVGEEVSRATIESIAKETLVGVRHAERVTVAVTSPPHLKLSVPLQSLSQALRGLVHNALDASPDGQPVDFKLDARDCELVVHIVDRGNGMTNDVRARAGEPFFTTKEPGKGMGLGLFLARNVVQRVGGTIEIESAIGKGTHVIVTVPST